MKKLLCLVLAALPACGNVYHPEYHPQTSVRYNQTLSYPVSVHGAGAQPVVIAPPRAQAMPPPMVPNPAPPIPEMAPPEMEW